MRSTQAAFSQLNGPVPPMPDVSRGHLPGSFRLRVGIIASQREGEVAGSMT